MRAQIPKHLKRFVRISKSAGKPGAFSICCLILLGKMLQAAASHEFDHVGTLIHLLTDGSDDSVRAIAFHALPEAMSAQRPAMQ